MFLEAFAAAEFSDIFSGRNPHQGVKVFGRFRHWLLPNLKGVLLVWYNQKWWPPAHPEYGDGVSALSVGKPSHLDVAFCPRKFDRIYIYIISIWVFNLRTEISSSSSLQPWVGLDLLKHVANNLYPGHPPTNFYNPIFLASSSAPSVHLDFGRPRPRWPPVFVRNIFLGNSFSSIRTTWPTHLSLLDFITLTVFGLL